MAISSVLQTFITSNFCIFVWSTFLVWLTLLNEVIRAIVSIILIFSRYELLPNGQDSINWSSLHTGKTVVIGLFSSEIIDVQEDVRIFKKIFRNTEANKSCTWEKLKKILCVRFGYGCLLTLNENAFNVQNHVKQYTAAGHEISEADFTTEILPILMETMDESKPQWEWIIFPKIRRSSGDLNSLRVFRYDHGYMDGASAGLFLAENIFDQDPTPEFFINPRKSYTSSLIHFVVGWWAYFNLPLFLLKEVFGSLRTKAPFSIKHSGKEDHLFGGPVQLDYKLIKSGTRSVNPGNILSLFLHCLGPTLGQVLSCQGDNNCDRTSSIIVSTLGAIMPYSSKRPQNQFTTIDAKVPLSDKDDEKIQYPVRDWSYLFSKAHMNWGGRFPIPLLRAFSSGGVASVSLNNVPFLRKKGTINGSLVDQVVGWGMLVAPIGLEIMAVAYGDKITLTFHTVQDCMTESELQLFIEQFKSNIISKIIRSRCPK